MTLWTKALAYVDLTTDGAPSFSKLVCLAILVTCIVRDCLTLGIVIALLAASFGRSVFLAFLKRSNVAAVETHSVIRQEIIDRRDAAQGIEPA